MSFGTWWRTEWILCFAAAWPAFFKESWDMKMKKTVDPLFDGHPEFNLHDLSVVDKLRYMSMQIELRHYIRTHVRKVSSSQPETKRGGKAAARSAE